MSEGSGGSTGPLVAEALVIGGASLRGVSAADHTSLGHGENRRAENESGRENLHDIGVFCRLTTWPRRLDLEWAIIVRVDPAIIAIVFERQRTPSGTDHRPLVGAWVVTP